MIEEIKNFIRQLVPEELIERVLVVLERVKEIATIVIEKLKELRDFVYGVFTGK